jgi:hypothetical protein
MPFHILGRNRRWVLEPQDASGTCIRPIWVMVVASFLQPLMARMVEALQYTDQVLPEISAGNGCYRSSKFGPCIQLTLPLNPD